MSGEAYVKRYGAGGFVDLPTQTTSIDSQFLNGVEAALARLLGVDPTADCVMVWDAGLGRFKTIKLVASEIDPAAGILKSQLAPLAITDADVAAGANIAASKLGGNIPVSKLNLPVTSRQILTASGTYTLPAGCRAILVECIGGGAAGGGTAATGAGQAAAGGGGTGGVYAASLITSPAATYAVTIGAGGTGVSGAVGNAGTNTLFGASAVVAPGGAGGAAGSAVTPPIVGASGGLPVSVGAVGGLIVPGEPGGMGVNLGSGGSNQISGQGGMAAGPYGGGGGRAAGPGGGTSTPGSNYGGGGSGSVAPASTAATGGAAGAPGLVVVTEYY